MDLCRVFLTASFTEAIRAIKHKASFLPPIGGSQIIGIPAVPFSFLNVPRLISRVPYFIPKFILQLCVELTLDVRRVKSSFFFVAVRAYKFRRFPTASKALVAVCFDAIFRGKDDKPNIFMVAMPRVLTLVLPWHIGGMVFL